MSKFCTASLLAGTLALAACAGAQPGGSVCPPIALLPAMMLYPIPGATNVPDGVGVVIYSGYDGRGTITLSRSAGGPKVRTVATPVPSPEPSPIASPLDGDVPTFAAAFGPLAPASTYSVTFNSGQTGRCSDPIQSLGTFTTQEASRGAERRGQLGTDV